MLIAQQISLRSSQISKIWL